MTYVETLLCYDQVYNTALLIHSDCRTIDALHYISKEITPENIELHYLSQFEDDTDKWLRKLFGGKFN